MPAIMLPHGCEGLRVRRMTVLWTFRRPFMGRPVPRQLLRNELLDLTTIVPATAYHRRSYAERYSRFSLYRYSDLPYTAIHPVKQSGKTLLAGKATNTRLFMALAATECAVPAGCSVLLFPVPTAGTLNVGTS